MATWPSEGPVSTLACPGGIEGAPTHRISTRTQKKQSRQEQPVAPPYIPPYREATSGRKQELDQEATPGRRNFFYRSSDDRPRTQVRRSCHRCWQQARVDHKVVTYGRLSRPSKPGGPCRTTSTGQSRHPGHCVRSLPSRWLNACNESSCTAVQRN
jgi:hypothetical protein